MAIEQTTNARNETLHLVLLDMSIAFNSIKRKELIEHLQHTISADELHIMKKMLKVSLVVWCGNSISEPFHTDTGETQGVQVLRASLIIYKIFRGTNSDTMIHNHYYHHQSITSHEISGELTERSYAQPTQIQHLSIEMEYANDLSTLTGDHKNIRRYKHNVEENLGKKN